MKKLTGILSLGFLLFVVSAFTLQPEETSTEKAEMQTAIEAALNGAMDGKGCHIYGKIKFVDYGEDVKVKFVTYGEDLKIKYVDYGEDKEGKWKTVEYGEDYKVKIVTYGEDYKVKEVDYGEGC